MPYLMRWSVIISYLYSWGKLPKPIVDEVLDYVTWVDTFPFGENIFVPLPTITDVHSDSSQVFTLQIPYSFYYIFF